MTQYSRFYRALHWLMALLIISLIPVGLWMADLPDETSYKDTLYSLHKSFGFLVLILAILRVFHRLKYGSVKALATLTPFERLASNFVHYALLVLIVIVPIAGFLGTMICCKPIVIFNLLPLNLPLTGSDTLVEVLFVIHGVGAKIMALLVIGHIFGALFHHFIKKDGLLKRMMKGE